MLAAQLKAHAPASGWNWLNQLVEDDYAIVKGLVPDELTLRLAHEARDFHENAMMERAGVGRADDFQLASSLRRDKTLWFDRASTAQSDYLDLMESVRLTMNRELFLGLFSYEAHYAAYERGGFYKRHLDAFRGVRNRVLSTVFYLNDDWQPGDGGELAIYNSDRINASTVMSVLPEFGTMVIFLSEEIPHEVMPTQRTRYSIAGWFRVNDRMTAPGLQAPSPIVADF